jgi:hypothetical protein
MKTKSLSTAILSTLALSALALASADAHANFGRNDCFRRADGVRGRQMGVRNADRLFNAIWSRLGRTCDQLDRLGQIISDTPFARSPMGGAFSACFYQGYTDTLWDQLGAAYERCQVRCFGEGIEIGRISAEGYCAASIAVGGLYDPGFISQPPLPFCGQNLVFGCKSEYVSAASFEINGCRPYTTGGFTETFENSVRQDCFVPSDVPIRDRLTLLNGTVIDLDTGSTVAALW